MSDNTIKCAISEVEKRCRIEIVLDSGSNRTEFLVKVLKEGICDANGPSAIEVDRSFTWSDDSTRFD